MSDKDKKLFAELLNTCADIYGSQKPSKDALVVFFDIVKKYDFDQFKKALVDHMSTSPFMVRPSDIVAKIEGSPEDRAALAWAITHNAIRKLRSASDTSVAFPLPEYNYVIALKGGWRELISSMTIDNETWIGKEFRHLYLIGDGRVSWEPEQDKIVVERYCVGGREVYNQQRGYELPDIYCAKTLQPIAGFREALPPPTAPNAVNALSEEIARRRKEFG